MWLPNKLIMKLKIITQILHQILIAAVVFYNLLHYNRETENGIKITN